MIESINWYNKYKDLFKGDCLIGKNIATKIVIDTFDDDYIKRNVTIEICSDFNGSNKIMILFKNVSKFIYPEENILSIAVMSFENIKSWCWEKSN